ncbi:MAG: GNAT family N-acetyltransferase, partial [Treponema sp.]|nr:GNAT family N-acetyltransferase [Treponema sp.]
MKGREAQAVEALLRAAEPFCMYACQRFKRRAENKCDAWTLAGEAGELSAVLFQAMKGLSITCAGSLPELPVPGFLLNPFRKASIYSLQGKKDFVESFEHAMEKSGRRATEKVDFYIMSRKKDPGDFSRAGPQGLLLRAPSVEDEDDFVALQAAYEREEVVSEGMSLNAAACRSRAQRILAVEGVMVAELDGRLIGKINTNAFAFTRCQIGGVYVLPEYR